MTTVDSGSKALQLLGLHDDHSPVPVHTDQLVRRRCFLFLCVFMCFRSLLASLKKNVCDVQYLVLLMLCMYVDDNQDVAVNLIITDYCMPGMTGYDLLKKIKVTTGLLRIYSIHSV